MGVSHIPSGPLRVNSPQCPWSLPAFVSSFISSLQIRHLTSLQHTNKSWQSVISRHSIPCANATYLLLNPFTGTDPVPMEQLPPQSCCHRQALGTSDLSLYMFWFGLLFGAVTRGQAQG